MRALGISHELHWEFGVTQRAIRWWLFVPCRAVPCRLVSSRPFLSRPVWPYLANLGGHTLVSCARVRPSVRPSRAEPELSEMPRQPESERLVNLNFDQNTQEWVQSG